MQDHYTCAWYTNSVLLAAVSVCFLTSCRPTASPDDKDGSAGTTPPAHLVERLYDGWEDDVESLRVTKSVDWGDGPINISTSQARHAAHRIFTMIDFKGMSRNDVWQLLGDPATIGDMGVPMASGPDAPMVYHFGTGLGGVLYILEFEGDVVVSVKTEPLI